MKPHLYQATIIWTGNIGSGTKDYSSYQRNHSILVEGKAEILGSSDPSFRGDKTRHNPEELFLTSIASCHMLWYLHLCSENGVIVLEYRDQATGTMIEKEDGSGSFTEVILHPYVLVSDESMIQRAHELHHKANQFCFIANSCNFPILHQPYCTVQLT